MISRAMRRPQLGFTLLEIIIVIAIIAILASLAIPSQLGSITQKKVLETIELVEPYKQNIATYYRLNEGEFPTNNHQAGLPEAEKIIGNYLRKLEINDGVMHLHLGKKITDQLQNKIISIRPVYVDNSPASPISWICGFDEVPTGMKAAGSNQTDVKKMFLPGRCR